MSIFSDTRYIRPEASFRLIDDTAAPDCTPYSSGQSDLSHIEQIIDDVVVSTKKIETLEHNLWVLDDSYEIIDSAAGLDTGWVSREVSDEEGNIYAEILLRFGSTHTSFGLTMYFDEKADSIPTEFTIKASNGQTVVAQYDIQNTDYRIVIQEGLGQYDSISIMFRKTSLPHRRVHVTEMLFGIVESFDDNSIVSFDIIKEIPSKCDSLPVSQITLTFDNSNNRYDMINPTGAYRYLKFGMPLKIKVGIGDEPTNLETYDLGTFYFYQAETADDGMTAVFTCQDILTYLDRSFFTGVGGNMAMANVIAEINQRIGSGFTWNNEITDTFKGPESGNTMSCRDLLQKACEATRAVCYVGRDEVINVKRYGFSDSVCSYDFDKVVQAPQISSDQRITKVTCEYGDGLSRSAEDRDPSEIEQEVKMNPDLINTAALAQSYADFLLEENRKYKYDFTGRGNPELNLGDTITVFDKYGNSHEAIVMSHNLSYDGGLTETIHALGGVIE